MKLYRNEYGWSTSAKGKELNGTEIKNYMGISFKQGSEPIGDSLEGKLIFRSEDGTEREGFFSSYRKKDGTVLPKLVLMLPNENTIQYQQTLTVDGRDMMGHIDHSAVVNPDELPFY